MEPDGEAEAAGGGEAGEAGRDGLAVGVGLPDGRDVERTASLRDGEGEDDLGETEDAGEDVGDEESAEA